MPHNCQPVPLRAVFGSARSGSTWLGSIISSHPTIAYRFEPFHRAKEAHLHDLAVKLETQTSSTQDLQTLYEALLPAHPVLEKPPFFQKEYTTPLPVGRSLLWPLTRKFPIGAGLFQRCYTPSASPPMVFKEVGKVKILANLVQHIPVAYLMRHPCAVVWSMLKGQTKNLMPSDRRQFLHKILNERRPDLAEQVGDRLEDLTAGEQEALLWRVDVEEAVEQIQSQPNGLLVIYEDLVEQPETVAERIFQHFGLDLSPASKTFIEESTLQNPSSRIQRGEIGINQYFTVFRDPKTAANQWKEQMSADEKERVVAMVQSTKPFQIGVTQGFWDN